MMPILARETLVSQFSPPTALVLACLAALGMVPVLGLPWYGLASGERPKANKGDVELQAEAVLRWFQNPGTSYTGAATLNGAETALVGIAGVTILLAALFLIPTIRASLRTPLALIPLAAPVIVLYHLIDTPGDNETTEPRWGIFVALALTLFMARAAYRGAEMGEKRSSMPDRYKAPSGPNW